MDFALAILIPAVAGLMVFFAWQSRRAERERWQNLAWALKLNVDRDRLVGIIDGYEVVVHKVENQPTYMIQVGGRLHLGSFDASRNDALARVSAALSGEYLTGDASFDRQVLLQGNELEVAAAMTEVGRAALLELLDHGLHFGNRALGFTVEHSKLTIPGVQRKIEVIVSAVKRMSVPRGHAAIQARLIENALKDPVPGVRKKNLELLLPQAIRNVEVMSAFQLALNDADPEVRLAAASRADLESESTESTTPFSVLRELAQGAYKSELRGRAIAVFAKRFPNETELFRAALHDAEPSVREAAAAALAKRGLRMEPGSLTLVEEEGGELSLSEQEGALSLATPAQDRQRSRRSP